MKIKTRFNTKDKVWFYIKEENMYGWGKVESMDVQVRCEMVETTYNIKNRFYKKQDYYMRVHSLLPYRDPPWTDNQYLSFEEEEVFENIDELKKHLELRHRDKMEDLKEIKKRYL